MPKRVLLVFLGGFLGTLVRYGVEAIEDNYITGPFSTAGTVTVNICSCCLAGFVACVFINKNLKAFLITGFCGGFSTLSAVNEEVMKIGVGNSTLIALAYLIFVLFISLAACRLGDLLGLAFLRIKNRIKPIDSIEDKIEEEE
ncbi:MAG: CrcB family protein [Candidatus Ancillula sp.]|jgi:CrcB protein|nr:CrcB family protein [Candidatus Ancillula sp.]